MKYYTLKNNETGLYYRGNMGWSTKPRLFLMGALKNSLRVNWDQLPAYKNLDYKTWVQLIAAHEGNPLKLLPYPPYELTEIIV